MWKMENGKMTQSKRHNLPLYQNKNNKPNNSRKKKKLIKLRNQATLSFICDGHVLESKTAN